MPLPNNDEIAAWVAGHMDMYHESRLQKLSGLNLKDVLKRKNPYLFRAKNVLTAEQLVRGLLDAYLSSQEETMFGDFLETLAIWINEETFNGRKSGIEGIDLEFDRKGTRFLVAIKSGPNWGNSQQIKRMRDNFRRAAITLRTSKGSVTSQAVNGCCYGRETNQDKGDYLKLCGQAFWEFISGSPTLYIDIVEPLGRNAKRRTEDFELEYAKVVNRMTQGVIADFFDPSGAIAWSKLLAFNSGKSAPISARKQV